MKGMSIPLPEPITPQAASGEAVWMEVIRKMDETYADLVGHQVELERKNAALQEAQAFIADVMGAMTDLMIVCDPRGMVRQVNHALERVVGDVPGGVIGRPVAEFFDSASAAQLRDMQGQLRVLGRIEDRAMTLVSAHGPYPLAVNLSALTDRRGRHTGVVLVGRPVGELKKAYADLAAAHRDLKGAQDRLVHSEKMASLGRLVAGVAHEINNPMSFVYGNAHTMRRYGDKLIAYLARLQAEAPDAAAALRRDLRIDDLMKDLPSVLEGIMEGAERTRDIVESLRRYSSEQAESRERIDLIGLIQTSIRWVIKGQSAKPETRFAMPETLEIEAHSGGIQQVVMNIVQNALDAQSERATPRLDVTVTREGEMAVVAFRDHGPGIADKDMRKLFDPFFTTKPVGRGTGLGLSISFEIVRGHGGSLEAANHPEGGAVFTLRLPVEGGGKNERS